MFTLEFYALKDGPHVLAEATLLCPNATERSLAIGDLRRLSPGEITQSHLVGDAGLRVETCLLDAWADLVGSDMNFDDDAKNLQTLAAKLPTAHFEYVTLTPESLAAKVHFDLDTFAELNQVLTYSP